MSAPSPFQLSEISDLEFAPYDFDQNDALDALLNPSNNDRMGDLFYPGLIHPDLDDFMEQYHQVAAVLPSSPGSLSSLSLPSSPLSFKAEDPFESNVIDLSSPHDSGYNLADELSVADPSSPYNLSPGFSLLTPVVDTNEARPAKTDLEDFEYHPFTRKWVCTKCKADFVSTHEARRHVKTAAKCTGKKVECLRCGDRVHASPWSRKRHFGSKKCQKGGRKRGTPAYTAHNAYVEVDAEL